MPKITACALPAHALLNRYAHSGAYTDCYCMTIAGHVSMAHYVYAFYTSRLFKIERRLLALLAQRPSTDQAALDLARGSDHPFAIWEVEQRNAHQLLLRQMAGPTRSWLMVESPLEGQPPLSRLYFGSAFVPHATDHKGPPSFSWSFHLLSGFHRLYTKALMRAAYARLAVVEWQN